MLIKKMSCKYPFTVILFLFFCLRYSSVVTGHELSGYLEGEGSFFFNDALFPGQKRDNIAIAFQPEYYHEWENGSSFTFVPFARLDSADTERTHFDVREFNFLWLTDYWELRLGVGKVFWGVTEFVHLVDIINQTDLVENIDGEDKLGQPMLHLSIPRNWGVVDMFLLPYFRERTFPGTSGRLRTALPVDTDKTEFKDSTGEWHPDFAIRYSHTIGDWDFGIYHFNGTGREPTLLPALRNSGQSALIPIYEQINQTGLDLQLVAGDWLWKLESIYRAGQGEDYFAGVGGFEYTFTSIVSTRMDLGLISELAYDDRGDSAPTPFENDIMFGLRLAVNDPASAELLAGFLQDLTSPARTINFEGSRRFGNHWKAIIEASIFIDSPEDGPFYSLRADDFIKLELAYYF